MATADTALHSIGIPATASTEQSRHWFDRARRVLAGGISSSARERASEPRPHPLYVASGCGSRIWDTDGHEFIDYLLSYGAAILGHADPGLRAAIAHQLDLGTMFGTCNTVEVELAEQVCAMVPSVDLVRFSNSGSEAICGAVRAARGCSGKSKILKFEGHYHGWVDVLAISNRPSIEEAGSLEEPRVVPHSKGIPSGVVEDVVICPWNRPDILRGTLDRVGPQLAAVIAEPIVANNACIMPAPGYLELLREECSRRGIALIFDEIVTGFRVAPGGAQELFGVEADLTVFSKALGGGTPISMFGGKHAYMDPIAANRVKHGGTYNANPLCSAAALHTLRELAQAPVRERMDAHGRLVMEAIRRSARDHRVPCLVQGLGPMFQVVFTSDGRRPVHYRDLQGADVARYGAFRRALLEQGIHINSSYLACWFVSAAHTEDDAELTALAIDKAMQAVS
jgi:glutamate-1-semialdehyde 2,1-aminomutase